MRGSHPSKDAAPLCAEEKMLKDKRRSGFSLSCFLLLASLGLGADGLAYPPDWSDDIRITFDPADCFHPAIAIASRRNVWVTWDDYRNPDGEIFYSKLDSLGNTLIDDTNLSNNSTRSWFSVVAVDSSDNVQIVWRDVGATGFDVWYAKLDSAGNVLVPNKVVAYASGSNMGSLLPAIAMDPNDYIHILWDQYVFPGNEIHYTKLDSDGNVLVPDQMLTAPGVYASSPALAIDSNNDLHVAWHDNSNTGLGWILTYAKLDNVGNILVGPLWLTPDDDYNSGAATVVIDPDDNVHIAFFDDRSGNHDVWYTKLDNNGNTLIDDKDISNSTGHVEYPDLAIDSRSDLHLVWGSNLSDRTDAIYYAKLDTSGNVLIGPMVVVDAPSYSEIPELAVDSSDRLHLVWQDYRNNNWDIYYKRGENEVGVEEATNDQLTMTNVQLFQNVPNPFSRETVIRYELASPAPVSLRIYDRAGQLVRTLVDGFEHAGFKSAVWDGKDDNGDPAASGIYFSRLAIGDSALSGAEVFTATKKLVILR